MEHSPFPAPMPQLPEPGHLVHWRCVRHARAIGWLDAYGPGPFEVEGLVDHGADCIPFGVVVRTQRGRSEINEVWLTEGVESANGWQGYAPELLGALD